MPFVSEARVDDSWGVFTAPEFDEPAPPVVSSVTVDPASEMTPPPGVEELSSVLVSPDPLSELSVATSEEVSPGVAEAVVEKVASPGADRLEPEAEGVSVLEAVLSVTVFVVDWPPMITQMPTRQSPLGPHCSSMSQMEPATQSPSSHFSPDSQSAIVSQVHLPSWQIFPVLHWSLDTHPGANVWVGALGVVSRVVSDGVLGVFEPPPTVEDLAPPSLLELDSSVKVWALVLVDPASEMTPPPGEVFVGVLEGPVSSVVREELDPSLVDNELVSALVFEVVGVASSSVAEEFVSSAEFVELSPVFVTGIVSTSPDVVPLPVELLSVDPASEIAPPPGVVVVSVGGAFPLDEPAPGVDSTPLAEDSVSVGPILVDPASEKTSLPGVVVSLTGIALSVVLSPGVVSAPPAAELVSVELPAVESTSVEPASDIAPPPGIVLVEVGEVFSPGVPPPGAVVEPRVVDVVPVEPAPSEIAPPPAVLVAVGEVFPPGVFSEPVCSPPGVVPAPAAVPLVSVDPASEISPPAVVAVGEVFSPGVFSEPVCSPDMESLVPEVISAPAVVLLVSVDPASEITPPRVAVVVVTAMGGVLSVCVAPVMVSCACVESLAPGVVSSPRPVASLSVEPASEIPPPPGVLSVLVAMGDSVSPDVFSLPVSSVDAEVLSPDVVSAPPAVPSISVDPASVDPASEILPPPEVTSVAEGEVLSTGRLSDPVSCAGVESLAPSSVFEALVCPVVGEKLVPALPPGVVSPLLPGLTVEPASEMAPPSSLVED